MRGGVGFFLKIHPSWYSHPALRAMRMTTKMIVKMVWWWRRQIVIMMAVRMKMEWLDLIYKCSIWVSITARFFSSHSWQPRFVSQENIKGTQRQIFSGCSMILWRKIIFENFPKYPSFSIGLFELQSQFKDFMLVKPMIALRLHFCTTLIVDLSRINCNLISSRTRNFLHRFEPFLFDFLWQWTSSVFERLFEER